MKNAVQGYCSASVFLAIELDLAAFQPIVGQMSKLRSLLATAALSFSLGLVACTANNDTNTGGPDNRCSPIAAQTLVGRSGVTDSEAKSITGAVTIRRVSPGDMVTQDFRNDRLTTEVNSHGIVVRAVCG